MANGPIDLGFSTGPAIVSGIDPRPIVLVGDGRRARAWLAPLRSSARLRIAATVARDNEDPLLDVPRHRSLAAAMRAHPAAAFAVALPPRAGLACALELAAAGRAGVVEAPLHDGLLDVPLAPGAAGVRVAHGWVTLAGARAMAAYIRRAGGGRLEIDVAGLPADDQADAHEALVHGAALIRALLPDVTVSAARQSDGDGWELDLLAPTPGGDWAVHVRLVTRGHRLSVRAETAMGAAVWSWRDERESVMLGDRPLVAPRRTQPAPLRALAQLLPDAPRGDGLAEAADVLRLVRRCLAALPTRVPLGGRAFRQSASLARRRPSDLLGRLGLSGELPGGGPPPDALHLVSLAEPFELWAFRAGIKPVVFLTVRPEQADATLAWFGDGHCERRERRVQVETQDRWIDRRDEGAPRVELYIARDASLARRMASLQADADPGAALVALGELAGYPPCCVAAFARQDDRANNSRNRYQSHARTPAPEEGSPAAWPWELNNLFTMIVPFYPCSYRCAAALAWARAVLAEMGRVHPAATAALRAALARPVLYFDHDHQLALDGELVDGSVRYRAAAVPPSVSPQLAPLASAIGAGDCLTFDDRQLLVERGGHTQLRLGRTDPALGLIAPFGVVP